MLKRVIFAGVLGGVAMFVWSFIAHMVLPLGEAGVQEIPNEQALLGTMNSTLGGGRGLYMFPGTGGKRGSEGMEIYAQKIASNPSGMLIYHPPGASMSMPPLLGTEFLTELAEALLLALVLANLRISSVSGRVAFAAVIGLAAAITTNVSYWNWYGFPGSYTASYMTIEFVSYLAAGLAAALVMRERPGAGLRTSA